MHTWFECKVKYEKTAEEGRVVSVNESYLVDALSFTEAESRIIKEMQPFMSGEFTVANIKRAKLAELFSNDAGDKWYRCKVFFISLDEEKGVEKRTGVNMLAQASSVREAWDVLQEGMNGSLADYEVASIVETQIMDVYLINTEEN